MDQHYQYSWHLRRMLILGAPMVASQVLQMAIGVTDALMVARLGELPLAQITLGTQFVFLLQLAFIGFQIAISVESTPAFASGNERHMRRALRMGLWQAFLFGAICLGICSFAEEIFILLKQKPEAIEGAVAYIDVAKWSLPPLLIVTAFRSYLMTLEKNNVLMFGSLAAFLMNILFNYALIFGNFGFPALGLVGSAWATLATNIAYVLLAFLIVYQTPFSKKINLFQRFWIFDREIFVTLLRLGLPISFGLITEVGMFQFSTIMIGWIGVSELAAHGLVMQIAGLTFMVPLGLSITTSIRVGHAYGRHDARELHLAAMAGLLMIMLIMTLTALSFWFAPEFFVNLILDNNREDSLRVAVIAVSYLIVAGAFQLGDGAQVAAMGALRGMKDTTIPAILAFIGYWPIGLGMGYFLAFHLDLGGQGVWMGLAIGLSVVAVFLWSRYFYARKRAFGIGAHTVSTTPAPFQS